MNDVLRPAGPIARQLERLSGQKCWLPRNRSRFWAIPYGKLGAADGHVQTVEHPDPPPPANRPNS